ncbi:MAG: putative sulfate exporter family transporter, partial [Pirellulaceae bacterium]|nr:putative sulfate exporter family transporter [Pirellulaceae bacterium]
VDGGPAIVDAVIKGSTKTLRGWFFCLAFVSIGLETNFKELGKFFQGGKPLILYVVGQSFNICLTLFMAWLMFEKVFPQAAASLGK